MYLLHENRLLAILFAGCCAAIAPACAELDADTDDRGPGAGKADDGTATQIPGEDCRADHECGSLPDYPGVCHQGICMFRATDDYCAPGSQDACPSATRCWSGSGQGICYPDCDTYVCFGDCDDENSCVGFSDEELAMCDALDCPEGQHCAFELEYCFESDCPRRLPVCVDYYGNRPGDPNEPSWPPSPPPPGPGTSTGSPCQGVCTYGAHCSDYCPPSASCVYVTEGSYWQVLGCGY